MPAHQAAARTKPDVTWGCSKPLVVDDLTTIYRNLTNVGLLVDIYVRIDDCLMIIMGVSINAGSPKIGDL